MAEKGSEISASLTYGKVLFSVEKSEYFDSNV